MNKKQILAYVNGVLRELDKQTNNDTSGFEVKITKSVHTVGCWWEYEKRFDFSWWAFQGGYTNEFIKELIVHEYCHFLTPETVHGEEWVEAMESFGYKDPDIYINDNDRIDMKLCGFKYKLKCNNCGGETLRVTGVKNTQTLYCESCNSYHNIEQIKL